MSCVLVLVAFWSSRWSIAAAEDKDGWSTKTNEQGKVVQELKIEAPTFTEEDQYGYNMPDRYRCDSCKAVMFHLDVDLRKKHPKSRRLKQWEYTDIMEETCRDAFQGYGVKLINGENTLSGPGLLANEDSLAPGQGAIQMGGDSWTKRLAEVCRKIVFEKMGEDEVYDNFYSKLRAEASVDGSASGSGTLADICTKDLGECRIGPKTPPRPRPRSEAEPKAKKPKKEAKKEPNKEPKAKKVSAKESSATSPSEASSTDRVSIETYVRSLAVTHGLTSDEYVTPRTQAEWDKLMLAIGGRIFSRKSEL